MSVRVAIGAARRHIVALLLTESCTLAVFGGITGFFVAPWTLSVIASLLPKEAADMIQLRLDPVVLMFAAVLTIGTGDAAIRGSYCGDGHLAAIPFTPAAPGSPPRARTADTPP